MSGEIVREWHFWLASVVTGVFMAFSYDVIRLFRRLVRHGRLAVDLEDMLYWTACFGLSFTLLYYGNNGVIRFAAVLGAGVGMLIYGVTVGRFFVRLSFLAIDRTVGALFRALGKAARKLRRMLRPIKRFAVKIYHKSKRAFLNLLQKIRLTHTAKRHKIKIYHHGKEEAADGRKDAGRRKKSKKRKKAKGKDTGVSPREK